MISRDVPSKWLRDAAKAFAKAVERDWKEYRANRTWGKERIAAELLLKLGIRISPRTIRRYMPPRPPRGRTGTQAWTTFIRNHAQALLACDFFVAITATFKVMYVFVVLEIGTRRILHWNVTAHPTAAWTAQQFRMIVAGDQAYRFVIHDRDAIYSEGVDRTLAAMGLMVLKTPVRAPTANACCERAPTSSSTITGGWRAGEPCTVLYRVGARPPARGSRRSSTAYRTNERPFKTSRRRSSEIRFAAPTG